MSYSSVAFICLIIFYIINFNIIMKRRDDLYEKIPAIRNYRSFLIAVLVFFVSDTMWGLLESAGLKILLFIDTSIFFCIMALTVFLWSRCILAYLNEVTKMMKFVNFTGWLFFLLQCAAVIINIFVPIMFFVDENGDYQTCPVRYISMLVQLAMYLLNTTYMLYTTLKSKSKKLKMNHLIIGLFGLVMTIFIFMQSFFPLLPLYSIGYIIGTCLLYTFVLEDIKKDRINKMKELLSLETKQRMELSEARHIAYTDSLTSVRNKHAYVEAESDIDKKIANDEQKEFGIIVFDLNGLKYVNDHFGHDAGDKYLIDACTMICNKFKHSAVFRIGGDEFVAIVEGLDHNNIDELLAAFDHDIDQNLIEYKDTESGTPIIIATGYSEYRKGEDNTFNKIFVRADKKMYERKRDLKEMGST